MVTDSADDEEDGHGDHGTVKQIGHVIRSASPRGRRSVAIVVVIVLATVARTLIPRIVTPVVLARPRLTAVRLLLAVVVPVVPSIIGGVIVPVVMRRIPSLPFVTGVASVPIVLPRVVGVRTIVVSRSERGR